MREIWFMQPRFERRMGKTIYRMIEQPRFRAACDFLQLRAAAGEFDSVLAQWWMDLANADDDLRGEMIEEVSRLPRDPADAPASTSANRRRRPRRARALGVGVSNERGSRAPISRSAPTWATARPPLRRCWTNCARRPASPP